MAFCITVRSDFVCLNSYILFVFSEKAWTQTKMTLMEGTVNSHLNSASLESFLLHN